QYGGVYRDGPHDGPALVKDKEWWQNCESMVGFLDAYLRIGDKSYFDAFHNIWEFSKKYLIREELGEWIQLVAYDGVPICEDIGNPWKAIYHTGRSIYECMIRLEKII
ncbi:MAG: AGE family epimerase/isomerase, partial [Vallitaleaceae bacterium]|nr:AGE family epimerase/isomerase [Vallitaleaceae bacterium]